MSIWGKLTDLQKCFIRYIPHTHIQQYEKKTFHPFTMKTHMPAYHYYEVHLRNAASGQ